MLPSGLDKGYWWVIAGLPPARPSTTLPSFHESRGVVVQAVSQGSSLAISGVLLSTWSELGLGFNAYLIIALMWVCKD